MEMTREVIVKFDDKDIKLKIKRMNLKERNEIHRQAMKIRMVGTQEMKDLDIQTLQELALQKCILEAPFGSDARSIGEIDFELADLIYAEVEKLNMISPQKKVE